MNVDWDLLADHLGGALAGTPEDARVAQLVATDPGWAQAAGALSAAMDAVAADLRTLPAPTMPDDVAARLTAALTTAPAPATRQPAAAAPPPGRALDEPRRPPAHPGAARRPRRRAARWSAGLAVAAGLATFATIGIGSWLGTWNASLPGTIAADDSGDSAGEDGEDTGAQPAEAPRATVPGRVDSTGTLLVATGTDYQQETLDSTAPPPRPGYDLHDQDDPSLPPQTPDNQLGPNDVPGLVPEPLFRLWTDPQARAACLALMMAALLPPPVTIDAIDFATFEGQPSVVIWATTGDATRWAWVTGPGCGQVSGDPDLQYQTEVS